MIEYIISRGLDAPTNLAPTLKVRKLQGTREASNGGRVRVRIIHGLNISHKELTYLLQKSISYRNKVLRTCSQGDRLVGKDHRSSPTATHKEGNQ